MKKITFLVFTVLALGFGFRLTRPLYAQEIIADEDPIQEEVAEETYVNQLFDRAGIIIASVGGVSGLAALGMFLARFIKDRALVRKILKEIKDLKSGDDAQKEGYNLLIAELKDSRATNDALINAFVNVLALTNLSPQDKANIIQGIKAKTVENMEEVLERAKVEIQEEAAKTAKIEEEAKTLLEKLAE